INAGVTGIRMDVNNLGATDLHLRLSFFDPVGADTAYSSNAVVVSPGSGWEQILFPIDPTALTGSANAAATLSNVAQVRLYHSPGGGPAPNGPDVAAQLGLDNVTAVPEPQTGLMLAAGLATLVAGKRVRGRR
ncbi:MAG: PEP-CTERM sorting domain-containing protein, partial [Burkholderiaceae bacterium]|nr:PEP-CTERM sorting domain-containing protein [Burkholderiaceae bacterium]